MPYIITFNNSVFHICNIRLSLMCCTKLLTTLHFFHPGDAQQECKVNIGAIASGGIIGGFILGFLVSIALLRFLQHCRKGIVTMFIRNINLILL